MKESEEKEGFKGNVVPLRGSPLYVPLNIYNLDDKSEF